MKDGDNPNPREPAQGTVSSHTGQALDSENSSGSVYHSPTATLEGDGCLTYHNTPSTHSESDSTDHFSDAIQESDDTASVYSAEEIPQRDDVTIQVLVSKSSLHQWSATASKVSILQNDNSRSHIPLPTHTVDPDTTGTRASKSFQFERAVETSEGSRIPVPLRLREALHGQSLKGSKSEPKIHSRNSSADRDQNDQEKSPTRNVVTPPEDLTAEDILSSESENITAITIQPNDEDGVLEKFKSDDLLGESGYIPFDNTDITAQTALTDPPEGVRVLPTAPPLSTDSEEKDRTEAQDNLDFVKTVSNFPESEPISDDHPLPERSPSYTIVSCPSQAFDVSDGEEPAEEKDSLVTPEPSLSSMLPADVPGKTEKIEVVELERAHQVESLPAPAIEYLQVDVHDLIAMGQANAKEAIIVSAERVDSKTNNPSHSQELEGTASSLKTLPSADEEDYVEIDDLTEPSAVKKITRFGKLKNKLQRRGSNKDVNVKKTGSTVKTTTLKVRRKPPKAPSSRPASAKRPITPPMMATGASILKPKGVSKGGSRFSNIRASIKQDVEKMKQSGRLELEILKKKSSSDIAIDKSEAPVPPKADFNDAVSSNPSIKGVSNDAPAQSPKGASKDGGSIKSLKITKEEDASVLSVPNQTKLNSLTSRYRVQMRKYKSQIADLTELQNKAGTLHDSLAHLKTQIVSIAGAMPTTLNDLPEPTVTASAASSEHKEETEPVNSNHIEEMTAENDNLRAENGRLHSNLNVVLRENRQIKEELSSVKEQLFTTRKQVTDLLKSNEERQQNMENLKSETQKAKRVAETYRRKMDEFQKSTHEQKVKNEEEKSRRMEKEKGLIAEVNALKNKLHIETTKREYTQNTLNSLSEEKETLEANICDLQTNIGDLNLQLLEQKHEMEKSKRDEEEYNLLLAKANKLQAELEASQKYCEALASRIDSSEKAEEETSKRLIQLSEELLDKMNLIQQLSEQQRAEHNKRADFPVADGDLSREKRRMRKFDILKSSKKKMRLFDDDERGYYDHETNPRYKIISNLSSLMGFDIDYQDLEAASDKEKCENTQLILKICSDFDKVLRNKDAEIEKQKQHYADLQSLHKEKQILIEQLYEFVNEKNASIYRKSSSPEAADNREEEKDAEKSSGMNIVEESEAKEQPDFQELYSMLEVKRHTLLRMESQIRSLQEVHAHCGMRRTMQESRIAELETMLANCLD